MRDTRSLRLHPSPPTRSHPSHPIHHTGLLAESNLGLREKGWRRSRRENQTGKGYGQKGQKPGEGKRVCRWPHGWQTRGERPARSWFLCPGHSVPRPAVQMPVSFMPGFTLPLHVVSSANLMLQSASCHLQPPEAPRPVLHFHFSTALIAQQSLNYPCIVSVRLSVFLTPSPCLIPPERGSLLVHQGISNA